MSDDSFNHRDRLRPGRAATQNSVEEIVEDDSAAFGYLRGLRERADALELRFLSGNRTWFPYSWLGCWKFDPSDGLLLKFSGDLVYLVHVTGVNLHQPLAQSTTNLTTSGLQRHRIVWMREMAEEDIRRVTPDTPAIETIRIAECETNAAVLEWLERHAPAFLK
jgi:hypothetical protein